MPFVETRLISPTTLTTSAASALYTVPTGYSAIIKQLVVTNITGTPATFTFYIGAASASNALFSGTSVAGNDTVVINLSQVLSTGETLRALASVGSALNLTVSGVINDGPLASTATYIPNGAITAAKIADGSIMDLEINASASIAKTKIAGTAITAADTGTVTSAMILNNTIVQSDLSTDIALSGMRNVIINGGMDIWQRGTGSIAPGNGSMTNTDRWTHTGVGTTFTQQTDVPAGLRYSLGVSGSDPSFGQKIEAANSARLAGQTVTFTIWAKNVSGSTSLFFNFYYPNSVDNFSSLTTIFSYTISTNMSASWTRYQISTSLPANVVNGLYILVGRSAGASNTYYTGAQLEASSQATPFEQRSVGTELALCQRYYWSSGTVWNYFIANNNNSFGEGFSFKLPVTMRATPTLTNSFTSNDNASLLNSAVTTEYVYIRETCGNATYPYSAFTYSFTVSAEL